MIEEMGMTLGGLMEQSVPPGDRVARQRAVKEAIAHREQMAYAESMAGALGSCKGFGLFSIYLLHVPPNRGGWTTMVKDASPSWMDNKMCSLLAWATFAVIVCQWLAPVAVATYLFQHVKVDMAFCPRAGGVEEKVLMSVISAIYCSKLYVRFYPRLTIKDRFYRYGFNVDWMIPSNTWIYDMGMPTSWREAYIADIVITDTIYDTLVYMFNLSLIFFTESPLEMVLNTVAFEFFTIIDDEFKTVALERIVERTYIQIYFAKLKQNPNYWVEKSLNRDNRFRKVSSPWIIVPAFAFMYGGLILTFAGIFFGPICK